MEGVAIARHAKEALAEQTGLRPERVVSLTKNDTGWQVSLESVEMKRIPDAEDVLAVYVLDLDEEGNLVGYHRVLRYLRGQVDDRVTP